MQEYIWFGMSELTNYSSGHYYKQKNGLKSWSLYKQKLTIFNSFNVSIPNIPLL